MHNSISPVPFINHLYSLTYVSVMYDNLDIKGLN